MNPPTGQPDSAAPVPTLIERDGPSAIKIHFEDGKVVRWTAAKLRQVCPCATCREKRGAKESQETTGPVALPVLSAAQARPISIASMQPVGHYGYNVQFSDGHASGIFLFDLLYRQEESGE